MLAHLRACADVWGGCMVGRVLERTVLFYAGWLARHERQHHTQFEHMVKTLR